MPLIRIFISKIQSADTKKTGKYDSGKRAQGKERWERVSILNDAKNPNMS